MAQDVLPTLQSGMGRVFALDYSTAIDVAKSNLEELHGDNLGVCFVQADALALPFKQNSFDKAFSIGVLHHHSKE